ncbi:MAG TPA: ATP-dependent DNA helicase RecG [Chitinophagales bacterium]|nr:ATP-dependent DNA helicase RecG [Chitinophagales bacterium]HNB38760.1 ATP-dependent DNA helicase RecG [Chitinophagales bacterium]
MSTQDKYAFLQTSIEYLKGVGPERAAILKTEANIHTFGDLLKLFPYRYIDRTQFYSTQHIDNSNTFIQLKGKIKEMREVGEGRGKRLSAIFYDQEGEVELVWFKGIKWIKDGIKPNEIYVLFGKPAWFNGRYNIAHPELELLSNYTSEALGGFKALYNTSEKMKNKGLDSKGIAKLIGTLFLQLKPENIHENIPEYVLKHYHLISRFEAYKQIHIPQNIDDQNNATKRLKFEELFFIQLNLLKNKVIRKKEKGILFEKIDTYFNNFYNNNLPFDLTNAQKRVLKEIRKDTLSGLQMNRLLQGDVGSGKTIIALLSMLMAFDNNYQAALMAPTEILAQQHFQNIQEVLNGMDVKIELLTGSTKTKQRKIILEQLKNGELNGIIGTHALIEDQVIFKNLGLAVVDEQHRFGVEQRAKLWKKNTIVPHILVMTATPIPRTLAMTLYGDLDVSVIDELPPGRKAIKTVHRYESHRIAVFEFMRDEIKKGRQIYIVYPLIAESEKLDLIDLTNGYESICRAFPMPEYHVSIVHGKMKPDDKNFEMDRFVKGITQIMVATTVIEVGVNVPNASVMIIENADRFGLSQLHQLRGRVGRGAEQSFCILMTDFKLSSDAKTRINTMVETNDGFKIAEVDLKLRGPGNIEGTQQSGTLDLRIANLATDGIILEEARKVAMNILEQDENLELPEHYPLKVFIQQKRQYNWSNIS